MSTSFIFLLLILGLVFGIFHHRKKQFWMLSLACILYFGIGSGILPSLLLIPFKSYSVSRVPDWQTQNAIVILGAGTTKSSDGIISPSILSHARILEGSALYHACQSQNKTCRIIISGGDPLRHGQSEAEIYKQALLKQAVKEHDIILESKSNNTYQNAEFTSILLKNGQFDRIYLVTSGSHMKRSLLYFSHFGIKPIPAAADYYRPYYSFLPLGINFALSDFLIHEYAGLLRYHLYNFVGLNTPKRN